MKDPRFNEAFTLRRQGHHPEALELYNLLWQEQRDAFSDWDGWAYAFSTKSTGNWTAALDLCRHFYHRFPQSPMIRQLYAQSIYHTQLGGEELLDPAVTRRAVEAMLKLSPPQEAYSLTPRAVFKLCRQLMGLPAPPWEELEGWLRQLDPDQLSREVFRVTDSRGKVREFASLQEEWYSAMIRVEAGRGRAEALLELLAEGRRRGIRWHYSNDVWFARKEAFALRQLGWRAEAEQILRRLAERKPEWFLLQDLAETVEDQAEALRLLFRAALSPGDNDKKVRLYMKLYEALAAQPAQAAEARQHLWLAALLRQANNWSVPAEMEAALAQTGAVPAQASPASIIQHLRPWWEARSREGVALQEGVIDHLLPGGHAGFIRAAGGEKYYFSVRDAGQLGHRMAAGLAVRFELRAGFDRKKQQPSRIAVNLVAR